MLRWQKHNVVTVNYYLRSHWLDIFDEVVGICNGALLQVIDDEIEAGFGDNIDQLWKHLQRPLAIAEHNLSM